jgi:hypothetical protein
VTRQASSQKKSLRLKRRPPQTKTTTRPSPLTVPTCSRYQSRRRLDLSVIARRRSRPHRPRQGIARPAPSPIAAGDRRPTGTRWPCYREGHPLFGRRRSIDAEVRLKPAAASRQKRIPYRNFACRPSKRGLPRCGVDPYETMPRSAHRQQSGPRARSQAAIFDLDQQCYRRLLYQ